MLKKAGLLLILCLAITGVSYGQYEDDAPDFNPMDTTEDGLTRALKDKLTPGLEFMFTANNGALFAELSPFVGYKLADPFMTGIGVHGSFLGAGSYGNFVYYGGYAFARLTIAETFFIHGEYRLLNGVVPNGVVRREWVGSPIAAAGIMYGSNSWMMIGYAINADYQKINPLGGLVYRIGLYF
jgi:hypothetical protein